MNEKRFKMTVILGCHLYKLFLPDDLAEVAELVDAPDSKSGDGDIVGVRVPPSVKKSINARY